MKPDLMPDQTQFIDESPLYAEEESRPAVVELSPEQLKQQKTKKIKFIILGIFGLLFISLLIFMVVQSRSRKTQQEEPEIKIVEVNEVVLGPFNQRVSELKKELEIADPSQEELPFPPVDFEINLEK